jgi:hypothetical protein
MVWFGAGMRRRRRRSSQRLLLQAFSAGRPRQVTENATTHYIYCGGYSSVSTKQCQAHLFVDYGFVLLAGGVLASTSFAQCLGPGNWTLCYGPSRAPPLSDSSRWFVVSYQMSMPSIVSCPKRVACKETPTQAALQLMMSLVHIPEAQRSNPVEIKRHIIDQYPDRARVSREPASTAECSSTVVSSNLLTSQLSSILAPWGGQKPPLSARAPRRLLYFDSYTSRD